jgi:hypothetical protein
LKGAEEHEVDRQLWPPDPTEQEPGESSFHRKEQATNMSFVPTHSQEVAQTVIEDTLPKAISFFKIAKLVKVQWRIPRDLAAIKAP